MLEGKKVPLFQVIEMMHLLLYHMSNLHRPSFIWSQHLRHGHDLKLANLSFIMKCVLFLLANAKRTRKLGEIRN